MTRFLKQNDVIVRKPESWYHNGKPKKEMDIKVSQILTGLTKSSKVEVVSKLESFIKFDEEKKSFVIHRESAKKSGVFKIKLKITETPLKKRLLQSTERFEYVQIKISFSEPVCAILPAKIN